MKIDQNVIFLKNVAGTAPLLSAKNTASVNRSTSELPSMAAPARPSSPPPLRPSTNGDFDAARVAEIRANIRAGRYQVDTAKIADGLLATVRDLLGTKTP